VATNRDPGDGNDVVEGQEGTDHLLFNGSNNGEAFNILNNGGRVLVARNIGTVNMDMNDVERMTLRTLGGSDTVRLDNMGGTDLVEFNLALESNVGTGDSEVDTLFVKGREGSDNVQILGAGTSYAVVGLRTLVNVTGSEGSFDQLVVETFGGSDTISAVALPAGVVHLTIDGGAGRDTIFGSSGADDLRGGSDNDFIDGNRGDDLADLGDGNDTFQWDPGDGSDIVEGQGNTDRLIFNGANISESIDISANGDRVRLFRDIGIITMDLNDIEQIDLNLLGGADTVNVNDMTGTDLAKLNIDLRAIPGIEGGDGSADNVIVNGTFANDVIAISGSVSTVNVTGLKVAVKILGTEAANDRLTVNSLSGSDTINANGLQANVLGLTLNGGATATP